MVCDRRSAAVELLACSRCVDQVHDDLSMIGRLFGGLDPAPGSAGSPGGRGSPGFGSRPTARLEVLVLTDPRTRRGVRGPAAVVNVLRFWSGLEEPVPVCVAGLQTTLDRHARHYLFGELAQDVRQTRRELERVSGLMEPSIPLGVCPVVVGWLEVEDPPEALLCHGKLRARVWGETARCDGDGRHFWKGLDELRVLADLLGDAWMDYAGLERYLGVRVSTLRVWALREGWRRDPDSPAGRPLYSLSDARATWMARRAA